MIDRQYLSMVRYKIKPGEASVGIYKNNIIVMTTFRNKGSETPNIRVNKLKRSNSLRHTERIRMLELLTEHTAKQTIS